MEYPDRLTRWLLLTALVFSILDSHALVAHLIFGLGK